jgi:hypothetical protein
VFRVYASKRRAEVAPGVGSVTDMIVIRPGEGGTGKLTDATLTALNSLYLEFQQSVAQNVGAKVTDLDLKQVEPVAKP